MIQDNAAAKKKTIIFDQVKKPLFTIKDAYRVLERRLRASGWRVTRYVRSIQVLRLATFFLHLSKNKMHWVERRLLIRFRLVVLKKENNLRTRMKGLINLKKVCADNSTRLLAKKRIAAIKDRSRIYIYRRALLRPYGIIL